MIFVTFPGTDGVPHLVSSDMFAGTCSPCARVLHWLMKNCKVSRDKIFMTTGYTYSEKKKYAYGIVTRAVEKKMEENERLGCTNEPGGELNRERCPSVHED